MSTAVVIFTYGEGHIGVTFLGIVLLVLLFCSVGSTR